jgi:hypothetical protein
VRVTGPGAVSTFEFRVMAATAFSPFAVISSIAVNANSAVAWLLSHMPKPRRRTGGSEGGGFGVVGVVGLLDRSRSKELIAPPGLTKAASEPTRKHFDIRRRPRPRLSRVEIVETHDCTTPASHNALAPSPSKLVNQYPFTGPFGRT